MKLLVVIQSVNFHGGAHLATWSMIDALKSRGVDIEVLSCSEPDDVMRVRLADVAVHLMKNAFPRKGIRYLVQGICRRLRLGWVPNWSIDPWGTVRRLMRKFDTVLVVGENSHLRNLVSSVRGPRKVVFIHTDYVAWRSLDPCARMDSKCDARVYRNFDCIGVVGKPNAERFSSFFPQFKDKVVAFHNLISARSRVQVHQEEKFTISTFGRLNWGPPKSTEFSVRIAARLKSMGFVFIWRSFGDIVNTDESRLKRLVRDLGVEDVFLMPGYCRNVQMEIARSTIVAHLSSYEGMSNTIYESLIQGTPVVATDVGGASEQIADGQTGRVVPFDESVVVNTLGNIMRDPAPIKQWRRNLEAISYDNDRVTQEYMRILGGTA